MSEGAFHGLSRYHSAPSSLLAALAGSQEEDLFHIPSDPCARESQALLASLFSEDFTPALPQQHPGVGIPPLHTNPHLPQPYPLQVQNPLPSSAALACNSVQFGGGNAVASEDFLCENKSWNSQPHDPQALLNGASSRLQNLSPALAAGAVTAPSSSSLPLTPPKTAITRQSSSPATFFNQLSGEFQMSARQKFSHRIRGVPLSVSYELQEPCLREESSDEFDGDSPGQSSQQHFCKKRSHSDISHQLGRVSEFQIAGCSDPSIENSAGLLPSNTTPCLARAKRGCATHPRSISERLRRTRISKGIKKLQELVPNMDKQINTANMLDEAVEYIKFLQKQVQELSKNQIVDLEVKRETDP